MACNAGGEFGRKIVHDKTAGYLDLYDLPGAMELPGKGTAGHGVTEQNAFVPHQIARVPWPTAARKVGGRGTGKDARFQELPRDQTGWLRLPEPYGDIKTFRHEIAQRVADQEFERQLWIRRQEARQPRCKHQSRKPRIDIHPELAADRVRRAGCMVAASSSPASRGAT